MALPLGSGGSKPKPAPKPPGLLAGIGRTVSGIGTTVAHVTHAPPPPSLASTLSRAPSIASSSVHQAVHAATTPHKAVIPRGDVQSSGSRYPGVNKGQDVNAYKKSAAYKAAVAETFLHQSLPQQGAILRGIMSVPNAYKSVEGSAIFKAWHALPHDHAIALGHYLPHGTGIDVGGLADRSLAGLANLLSGAGSSQINPEANVSLGGVTPAGVSQVLTHAPIDVVRATLQDPTVIPKTIKGLGETAIGSVAALADLPVKVVQEGPTKALSQLGKGIAADYSQRYGPLASGNDQAFIARIKKQGAGPELLDALGVIGGADAILGRGLTGLAKTREALAGTEGAGFLTRERPGLRVSGGEVRSQQLARGAGKITAQRVEDALRRKRRGAGYPIGSNEVHPIFRGRATRILVSQVASKTRRTMQEALNREVRHGAERHTIHLSSWERKAMPVVVEGTIPLRSGPEAARQALEARAQSILRDRAENPLSPGNRIPPQLADQVDELKLIRSLQEHTKQWVTDRLATFVDREGARSARLEQGDLRVRPESAEARRLRPQGEALGVEHPDDAAAREIARLSDRAKQIQKVVDRPGTVGELHAARAQLTRTRNRIADLKAGETRPQALLEYSRQVRQQARAHGLPEPAYMKHQAHPKTDFGAYTQGQGHRAMPGAKQSKFVLYRSGVVDRSPQAYIDSLAKQIKGGHQWRLVDEQFRRNALPTPTRAAIRAALGHDKHPADLTGFELQQALLHMGVDMRHVKFYNPGRLAQTTLEQHDLYKGSRAGSAPPELETNAELHHELNQDEAVQDGAQKPSEAFLTTKGWKALPRDAFDEIHSSLNPSGMAGRIVGKVQGTAAAAILGLSPSFVIMNSLAHVFLATFGTRGRILTDAVKFPLWWHGIPEDLRNVVRQNAGGRGAMHIERLGSTARSDLARSWQDLRNHGILRAASHLNPFRALFRAEDIQSNYFRHMVYYSAAKRQALENIGHDLGPAARASAALNHAFTVGPKDGIAEVIGNEQHAEELGRYTVNMMGDYARFSSRERKWLNNRAVLFYSFLRHATRTLLYVLPFKHPIATALVGELAKLHDDEVKKMLGGKDLPWTYSRLFFTKGGKLTSVDLMRSSPVGSSVVDAASQGVEGLSGLVAPEVQPILDLMYGQTSSGQAVPKNVFTALNDYLSLSYPYRLAKGLHFGTQQQQPDSIPVLHERPQRYKSSAAREYQAQKAQALGPAGQKILGGLLGVYPKPDDSKVIAAHRSRSKGGSQPSLAHSVAAGVGAGDLHQSLGGSTGAGSLKASLGH